MQNSRAGMAGPFRSAAPLAAAGPPGASGAHAG